MTTTKHTPQRNQYQAMKTPQTESELQLESVRVHLSNMLNELEWWLIEWKTHGRPPKALVEGLRDECKATADKVNKLCGT